MDLAYYKLNSRVLDPFYGSEQAACFDIHAFLQDGDKIVLWSDSAKKETYRVVSQGRIVIYPSERILIPTGLIFNIQKGYSLRLHARSGQTFKQGLVLANSEGIIDSDYVLETKCIMMNVAETNAVIFNGDRICQAELVPVQQVTFLEQTQPPEPKTDRQGGFGSTGV